MMIDGSFLLIEHDHYDTHRLELSRDLPSSNGICVDRRETAVG